MSITLNNGSVTFGDGSVQSTKTPTVISAFTNDSAFITDASLSPTYANINNSVVRFSKVDGGSEGLSLQWYNVDGTLLGSGSWNCNCNC